ncbi:MAG TPA: glycerophosphodiester phosphodiesterase [Myxococcota bacterium]|jgi:glycerophosphoryl diester phosphodiesterase
MPHPFFAIPRPIVFGHRGACGERPENTLISFERALAQGADVLETDVHATRDGEVVVLHDADVARTTDGSGDVATSTWDELRRLDAGHRFAAEDGSAPFRGRDVRIPRLDEALARFPGVRFNIELKRADERLIGAVLDLLRSTGRESISLLAAERDDAMRALRSAVRARGSRVALGASAAEVLGFVRAAIESGEPPAGPMALQIPAEFLGRPLVTPELVSFAHAQGVQVHVWTINEPAEMRRLIALGVDGVMSDFPGRLRRVVDETRGA